jgi:hypothetical protein
VIITAAGRDHPRQRREDHHPGAGAIITDHASMIITARSG